MVDHTPEDPERTRAFIAEYVAVHQLIWLLQRNVSHILPQLEHSLLQDIHASSQGLIESGDYQGLQRVSELVAHVMTHGSVRDLPVDQQEFWHHLRPTILDHAVLQQLADRVSTQLVQLLAVYLDEDAEWVFEPPVVPPVIEVTRLEPEVNPTDTVPITENEADPELTQWLNAHCRVRLPDQHEVCCLKEIGEVTKFVNWRVRMNECMNKLSIHIARVKQVANGVLDTQNPYILREDAYLLMEYLKASNHLKVEI